MKQPYIRLIAKTIFWGGGEGYFYSGECFSLENVNSFTSNHKNCNFLNCDWFKKLLFPTNSLAELLSDSLLSDSSTNQSHSKL